MDTLIYRAYVNMPDRIVKALIIDMLIKENLALHEIMFNKKESYIEQEVNKMILKKQLIYNNAYILNRTNEEVKGILEALGYSLKSINLISTANKINAIFRGKRGISDSGYEYPLSETNRVLISLQKFTVAYPEYDEDIIVQATQEYFNSAQVVNKCYYYAPKVSTFIEGSDSKEYLKEICSSVLKRRNLANLNVSEEFYV